MDATKRGALALTMTAAAMCGVITSACGGDDTAVPTDGGADATTDSPFVPSTDGNAPADAADSATDAGVDTDAGPQPHVYFINGAIDLPALAFCFATGTASDGTDAFVSKDPAQPAGGSIASGHGSDAFLNGGSSAVTPIAVLAPIPVGKSCQDLLGPHGVGKFDFPPGTLESQVDFFALPTIAAGQLTGGHTYIATLVGCLPQGDAGDAGEDPNGSAARCGGDYDGGQPTFALSFHELDTTTAIGTSAMGVQVAYESAALQGLVAHGGITVGLADGGPIVSSPMHAGDFAPAAAVEVPFASSASLRVDLLQSDGGPAPGSPFVQSLGSITGMSDVSADATFMAGRAYTFVLVGDPSGDGGLTPTDGHGLHFTAVDNGWAKFIP